MELSHRRDCVMSLRCGVSLIWWDFATGHGCRRMIKSWKRSTLFLSAFCSLLFLVLRSRNPSPVRSDVDLGGLDSFPIRVLACAVAVHVLLVFLVWPPVDGVLQSMSAAPSPECLSRPRLYGHRGLHRPGIVLILSCGFPGFRRGVILAAQWRMLISLGSGHLRPFIVAETFPSCSEFACTDPLFSLDLSRDHATPFSISKMFGGTAMTLFGRAKRTLLSTPTSAPTMFAVE